jgi:biopolymer transport protein ExbD
MIEFEYGRNITEGGAWPDMTPMIDMIFQLLIFFLLTSFFIMPAVNVSLPKSRTAQTQPPGSLVLTVEHDGNVRLAGQPVSLRDLPAVVGAALARRTDRTVLIQSDRGVAFGRVVEVMEVAREAGAGEISFLVERVESAPR